MSAMLPRFLSPDIRCEIVAFNGKHDLLSKLPGRLRGLRYTMPDRVSGLVDRDSQDCKHLKEELERIAHEAGVTTLTVAAGGGWEIANRIVIEELEAWYFGDWDAVVAAYPRAPLHVAQRSPYRKPDEIRGGTCERFAREMRSVFPGGLVKTQAAERIGGQIDPGRSKSPSFAAFWRAVLEAAA